MVGGPVENKAISKDENVAAPPASDCGDAAAGGGRGESPKRGRHQLLTRKGSTRKVAGSKFKAGPGGHGNGPGGNGGWSPLHIAARRGQLETMKALIEQGKASVWSRQKDEWTALHLAAQFNHLDVVEWLLEQDPALVDARQKNQWTALHLACQEGHYDVAVCLLENGANIEAKRKYDWTPLHTASRHGNARVVKLLVENGANLEPKDTDGWTPLYAACLSGSLEVVRYLLKKGAEVNMQDGRTGSTPLHAASRHGHLDVVAMLLEFGASLEVPMSAVNISNITSISGDNTKNTSTEQGTAVPSSLTARNLALAGQHIHVAGFLDRASEERRKTGDIPSSVTQLTLPDLPDMTDMTALIMMDQTHLQHQERHQQMPHHPHPKSAFAVPKEARINQNLERGGQRSDTIPSLDHQKENFANLAVSLDQRDMEKNNLPLLYLLSTEVQEMKDRNGRDFVMQTLYEDVSRQNQELRDLVADMSRECTKLSAQIQHHSAARRHSNVVVLLLFVSGSLLVTHPTAYQLFGQTYHLFSLLVYSNAP